MYFYMYNSGETEGLLPIEVGEGKTKKLQENMSQQGEGKAAGAQGAADQRESLTVDEGHMRDARPCTTGWRHTCML